MTQYVIYKGEEVVAIGTRLEVAERLGVKPETIDYYASPCHWRRGDVEKRLLAVRVYDD
jgi:phosphosulfolactate phosphohydrolase-like enzyme